jgi:hypothetical protein
MYRVKDFNPVWLQVLQDASVREIIMPMTREEAIHLRQRLNKLREAMKAEGHPLSDAAQKVKITLEFQLDQSPDWLGYSNEERMSKFDGSPSAWRLRLRPYDLEFESILEGAGYKKDILV